MKTYSLLLCALFSVSANIFAANAANSTTDTKAWPHQPLKIVVPFAPGGTSDVIARLISKPLGDALNTTVIVENKTGASGNIGAAAVANATDNHTILLSDLGSLAIAPLASKDLPFNPENLKGVTMLAYSPHLLAVPSSFAAKNLAELVAASKIKAINVASSGSNTPNHLGVVEIALATGLKWQHVPYRGGAQAITDTVAGNTQLLLNGMLATLPMVQGGKLRAIAISKRTRMALLPDVPTIAEQGGAALANFESGTYQGVVVAKSLPDAHLAKLNAALIRVIRSPEIRARLVELGAEISTSTPAEASQFLVSDRKRWASVMQRAGDQIEGSR